MKRSHNKALLRTHFLEMEHNQSHFNLYPHIKSQINYHILNQLFHTIPTEEGIVTIKCVTVKVPNTYYVFTRFIDHLLCGKLLLIISVL